MSNEITTTDSMTTTATVATHPPATYTTTIISDAGKLVHVLTPINPLCSSSIMSPKIFTSTPCSTGTKTTSTLNVAASTFAPSSSLNYTPPTFATAPSSSTTPQFYTPQPSGPLRAFRSLLAQTAELLDTALDSVKTETSPELLKETVDMVDLLKSELAEVPPDATNDDIKKATSLKIDLIRAAFKLREAVQRLTKRDTPSSYTQHLHTQHQGESPKTFGITQRPPLSPNSLALIDSYRHTPPHQSDRSSEPSKTQRAKLKAAEELARVQATQAKELQAAKDKEDMLTLHATLYKVVLKHHQQAEEYEGLCKRTTLLTNDLKTTSRAQDELLAQFEKRFGLTYFEWVNAHQQATTSYTDAAPGVSMASLLNPHSAFFEKGKRDFIDFFKEYEHVSGNRRRKRSKSRHYDTSSSEEETTATPKRARHSIITTSPPRSARKVLFSTDEPEIIPATPPPSANAFEQPTLPLNIHSAIATSTPTATCTPTPTPIPPPTLHSPQNALATALNTPNFNPTQLILELFEKTLNYSQTHTFDNENRSSSEAENASTIMPPPPPPLPIDAPMPVAVPPLPQLWESVVTETEVNIKTLKPPKFQLGKFSGDKLYYRPFIENFRMYVHERQDLSLPQKIQYLEDSLSEEILKHIKHYPATPEGYKAKLKHLHEKYGNENEIREELWRKFTTLQPLTRKVPDVQQCFEQAKLYVNLLKLYYGTDVKLDHLRTVFCQKFPAYYYENRLDPSDDTLDHLIHCIDQTLKVKNLAYEASKGLPSAKNKTDSPKAQHTFFTKNNTQTTPTRGKGRGRGRGRGRGNATTQHSQKPTQTTTTANNTRSSVSALPPSIANVPRAIIDIPHHPSKAKCYFCGPRQHWTHLCIDYPTKEQRINYYTRKNRCPHCGEEAHTGKCTKVIKHVCMWFHCGAENDHHSGLCPKTPWPVTPDIVQLWHKELDRLQAATHPHAPSISSTAPITTPSVTSTNNNSVQQTESTGKQTAEPRKTTEPTAGKTTTTTSSTAATTTTTATSNAPQLSTNMVTNFTFSVNDNGFLVFTTTISKTPESQKFEITGFFDCASSYSYIIKSTAFQKLHLTGSNKKTVSFTSLQKQKSTLFVSETVSFCIFDLSNSHTILKAQTVEEISNSLPLVDISHFIKSHPQYSTLTLARVRPYTQIDLLIGNDAMWLFFNQIIKIDDYTRLFDTKFGHMVTYQQQPTSTHHIYSFTLHTFTTLTNDQIVEKLWVLEAIGITDKNLSTLQMELAALDDFYKNINEISDRYQIKWPYCLWPPPLPHTTKMAIAYIQNQIAIFQQHPIYFQHYDNYFLELDTLGITEDVTPEMQKETTPSMHLPHSAIIDPTKTTPVRVVFNGAAKGKTDRYTINDCLHKGLNLIPPIPILIIKFRLHAFALIADIRKAFHQIELHPDDRNVTKFFWIKDPHKPLKPPNLYEKRFKRVPFGLISSPFILNATLRYHFKKHAPHLEKTLIESFYMDNFLTSTPTLQKAATLFEQINTLFSKVSMELAQWGSNSPEIRQLFQANQTLDTLTVKLLGILWNQNHDVLFLNPKITTLPLYTKTTFVSQFSKLFDPLGWFAPLLVPIKALLKAIWDLKIGWDDTLPTEMHPIITHYLTQLIKATEVYFPRQLFTLPFNPDYIQLHVFVDASKIAYLAIMYFRLLHPHSKKCESKFLFAKARAAPKNASTIPRLELIAATIGARLISFLREHYSHPTPTYLWTDSKCVLVWLLRRKILPTFVENRVREIHNVKEVTYKYVPTEDNPADIGSRGATFKDLHTSIWWSGPPWLVSDPSHWPDTDLHIKEEEVTPTEKSTGEPIFYTLQDSLHSYAKLPEHEFFKKPLNDNATKKKKRKIETTNAQLATLNPTLSQQYLHTGFDHEESVETNFIDSYKFAHYIFGENKTPFNIDINKYSKLSVLIGSICQLLKWTTTLYKFVPQPQNQILKKYSRASILHLLTYADQRKFYNHLFEKLAPLPPNTIIYHQRHQVYKSEIGFLHIRPRLPNTNNTNAKTDPLLLHFNSPFTRLLVLHYHILNFHTGTNYTLAAMRQDYFVPRSMRTVTNTILKKCQLCKIRYPKPLSPPMIAELPSFRLEKNTTPFTYTGVDIFGPFQTYSYVTTTTKPRNESEKPKSVTTRVDTKRWVLIFTCLVTRAVYLIPIANMTAATVWTAFVTFMADRTTPTKFVSDNGAQFHVIKQYINEFWTTFTKEPQVERFLQDHEITWLFRPAHAPWYGGIYERIIGIIKQAYYKVHAYYPLHKQIFYQTIKNLQLMVNHRPLCPTSDTDFTTLTPAHFLNINLSTSEIPILQVFDKNYTLHEPLPPTLPRNYDIKHLHKHTQIYTKHLWNAWYKLYVLHLRDKPQSPAPTAYRTSTANIKIGDLVHVLDKQSKYGTYKLAKILDLPPSHDNKLRQAKIAFPVPNSSTPYVTTRAFQNLAPLELQEETSFVPPQSQASTTETPK